MFEGMRLMPYKQYLDQAEEESIQKVIRVLFRILEKHLSNPVFLRRIGGMCLLRQNQYFKHVVIKGGTALRLFYGNPRFSEEIDLVLQRKTDTINFKPLSKKISNQTLPLLGVFTKKYNRTGRT